MSHDHGCCDHSAGGAKAAEDAGLEYGLRDKIIMDEVECLNEAVEGSGKTVFKPQHEKLDKEKFVISDADEELLFNVPFSGNVKLKGIIVIGGAEGTGPDKMRLFKNRPHMTFDDARGKCDQEFSLVQDAEGKIEYETKVVQFSSVHHLTLHFPSNFAGDDETKIFYIGLRGDFFKAERTGVVNAVYEARPMMQDHKQDADAFGMKSNNPGF